MSGYWASTRSIEHSDGTTCKALHVNKVGNRYESVSIPVLMKPSKLVQNEPPYRRIDDMRWGLDGSTSRAILNLEQFG